MCVAVYVYVFNELRDVHRFGSVRLVILWRPNVPNTELVMKFAPGAESRAGADFYVPSPESDSGPRHPMVSGRGQPPGHLVSPGTCRHSQLTRLQSLISLIPLVSRQFPLKHAVIVPWKLIVCLQNIFKSVLTITHSNDSPVIMKTVTHD